MIRAIALCLCLLIPTPAIADPLAALGLAKALPFILGFLLVGLGLLVAGFFISRADFRSQRSTPGLPVILAILFAFVGGVLISRFFFEIDNEKIPFPNILTELYVPAAALLLFLKRLRLKPDSSFAVFWVNSITSCLLVLITPITGFVAAGELRYGSSRAIMTELFFTPIIWFVVFRKLDKWRITANTKFMADAWLIPVAGSVAAVLYESLLYTANVGLSRSEWSSKLLPEQGMRLLLYCVFGFLVMATTIWISPTQKPKPEQ